MVKKGENKEKTRGNQKYDKNSEQTREKQGEKQWENKQNLFVFLSYGLTSKSSATLTKLRLIDPYRCYA